MATETLMTKPTKTQVNYAGTQMKCGYQMHENLTDKLRPNPNRDFVRKYEVLDDVPHMLIFHGKNKALPMCDRCLAWCKSIGQMSIEDD